jgi:glycosyltransferase involved in cell wall biosynthesis
MKAASRPKVSVIMPVYNGASFLKKAVNSLLAQSFQNWELVVVDDGSTDATPQILEGYDDVRIRVIRQVNGGEANARNTGLGQVRGEYIAFLDADDEYLPNALEDLSRFLDDNLQYGVAFSDGYICDQEDLQLMRLTEIRPGIFTGNVLDAVVMSPSVLTVPVCSMTRRSGIQQFNIKFDEQIVIGPDWDFWIRLAVHVEFGYLDRLTCKYRVHTNNITRTTASEKRKKDKIYRRMKILNSDWFPTLSLATKESFFLDLLINTLSGDIEKQKNVLGNEHFQKLPAPIKSALWRSAGIDMVRSGHELELVRSCFQEALNLDPGSFRSQLLLWGVRLGRPFVMGIIKLWLLTVQIRQRFSFSKSDQSVRLQKLLGVQ